MASCVSELSWVVGGWSVWLVIYLMIYREQSPVFVLTDLHRPNCHSVNKILCQIGLLQNIAPENCHKIATFTVPAIVAKLQHLIICHIVKIIVVDQMKF